MRISLLLCLAVLTVICLHVSATSHGLNDKVAVHAETSVNSPRVARFFNSGNIGNGNVQNFGGRRRFGVPRRRFGGRRPGGSFRRRGFRSRVGARRRGFGFRRGGGFTVSSMFSSLDLVDLLGGTRWQSLFLFHVKQNTGNIGNNNVQNFG